MALARPDLSTDRFCVIQKPTSRADDPAHAGLPATNPRVNLPAGTIPRRHPEPLAKRPSRLGQRPKSGIFQGAHLHRSFPASADR